MTRITDIVQIDISRETAAVSQTNFEVPMFLAVHAAFPERARRYTSLIAVGEDFSATSVVYKAAAKAFSAPIKPDAIIIGRRAMTNVTVTPVVTGAVVGDTFVLTVNGIAATATFAASDTPTIIATKLKTAYDVAPVAGVAVTAAAGVLTVTPSNGAKLSLGVSTNLTQGTPTSSEALAVAYAAVQAENDTFYLVTSDSHVDADVMALAAIVEGQTKLYGVSLTPAVAGTTSTTDTLSKLKAGSYFRTYVLVTDQADTEFPEFAWGAYQIQEQAGSNTWAYKSLAGITVSNLSDTVSATIQSKNGNTYETVGGLNLTIGGKTAGGEWIDVIVFIDWLEARMRERIFFRLANSKKIPYTAAGAAIVETDVRAQLREGVRVGGLAESPAPTVFVPDVLSISAGVRASRVFEGLTFSARLAGAMHILKIQGTVTV